MLQNYETCLKLIDLLKFGRKVITKAKIFVQISCQALPASPQNLPRYQVSEFLTESRTKADEPTTKRVFMIAPKNLSKSVI